MRIALTHPTYWPEVRRGSERVVHDLGVSLVSRGHDVTLLTSHRGRRSITVEDGVTVVRRRRPARPRAARRYEDLIESAPGLAWELHGDRFDVVHAFFPVDGWVASLMRRRRSFAPFVFSFHGIPTRQYLVARRYRMQMLQAAVGAATVASVLSDAAAEVFRRHLLRSPLVLPAGVMGDRFAIGVHRAREPTLLCTASLRDPRKRGPLLLEAFASLRERVPSARLLLDRPRDPLTDGPPMPELPPGAAWIDLADDAALATAYASAWATVLPAPAEAFGLVLVESMAAGTPVVAARSGAGPQIVRSGEIGRLFDPDDTAALAAAMLEALRLAERPGTRSACRERAADYQWSALVERYEDAYRATLGARAPESSRTSASSESASVRRGR